MTRNEKLIAMDLAAKEDRERLFVVTDGMWRQPKYADYLTQLEEVCQQWRDMTDLENWPEVAWPLALPDWMPTVKFASGWEADYAVEENGSEAVESEVV